MSGLLGGGAGMPPIADLMALAPGNPYRRPARTMTAGHLTLGHGVNGLASLWDADDAAPIAPEMRPYEAGLQPYISPAGTAWQEEVIFDRIARTDAEIQTQLSAYFQNARSYDSNLSRLRVLASDYYNGRPLGDEEPGRSQLVLTTVRDTIRSTLPSLLRVFTAVENPVEFTPAIADNAQLGVLHAQYARQATAYAKWALFTANQGWIVLHDAILDALTRKIGWVRWYWGQQRAERVEECDRLLQPQVQMLLREPGIEAQRIVRRPMLPNEQRALAATAEGMAYFQAGGEPVFYACRITRAAARAWPMVEYVPSECVWVVPDADQVDGARAIFHVRDLPASDLIEAGLPREKILEAAQGTPNPRLRREQAARDAPSGTNIRYTGGANDPSMRIVRYSEAWCRMDTDGDGIAELIHLHCVGMEPKIIRWDRTDQCQLAGFSPYREPGRIIGMSQADMAMDLQRTQTRVLRGILDSLGQSLFPRTVIQVGSVNVEDARQTAIGSIIRVTQQGAVTELSKPFVGSQALPVLDVLEAIGESRTGITRTSRGLTAESLQSTTPTAVSAQTDASGDRLDMIARTLAETGLVAVYKGLLRMMAAHQDRPNMLSINGQWIAMDPRALSIMWAVQVNIGGKGSMAERLSMLSAIAGKQETILAPAVQQGMLDTPLVGLPEYRNTLARMCEVAGISDVQSYFKDLPPGWQPPPPPNKPSVDEMLAQVQQQKTAADAVDDARKADNERLKLLLEDNRSRAETAVNAWVAAYATAAANNTPLPSIDEFKAAMRPPPIPPPAAAGGLPAGSGPLPGGGAPAAGPPGIPSPIGAPAGALAARPMAPGAAVPMRPPIVPNLPPAPVALPPNAVPPGVVNAGGPNPVSPAAAQAIRMSLMQGAGPGGNAAMLLRARGAPNG